MIIFDICIYIHICTNKPSNQPTSQPANQPTKQQTNQPTNQPTHPPTARGEPTPYAWPNVNSHFGIIDIAGFPKDTFWYYQTQWVAAKTQVGARLPTFHPETACSGSVSHSIACVPPGA